METELTIELNSIKYLIVEELVTRKTENKVIAKAEKYNAIYQGIKEIGKNTFFSSPNYIIVKYLVPEYNIIMYNKE